MYQYYKIKFQYTSVFNFLIMTLNYVLYPIFVQNTEKVHFEGLYLFPLHQHTVTYNSTIWRHSRYITSVDRKLNKGALSGVSQLLWGRSWLLFKLSGFSNIRQYTTVTNQFNDCPRPEHDVFRIAIAHIISRSALVQFIILRVRYLYNSTGIVCYVYLV